MPVKAKSSIVGTAKSTKLLAVKKSIKREPSPTAEPKIWTRLNIALCIVLAVATLAIYSRTIRNSFVDYDDPGYVTENQHVQQGLTAGTVNWAFTTTEQANWHPLTWLSHALDFQLYGSNPAGHHITSILLHAISVVALFLLLVWITGAPWQSVFVAALFALHPFNVESVAWVSERKNVLSMFFFVLTLGAYSWYVKTPNIRRYLAVFGLFAVGLLAKPMIVTLPCVLLLLDLWPLQRSLEWTEPSRTFSVRRFSNERLILEKLPLLALSAASSVITILAQQPALKSITVTPLSARVVNALYSYAAYLWKALWPVHLGVFYSPKGTLSAWQVAALFLFLMAVSVAVWRARSRKYLLVGWLWFLGTLVPMIGVVQVGEQGMADRYAYLPLIGIFIMVVWGTADLIPATKIDPRPLIAMAGIAIILLSVVTWRQIGTWENSFALWSRALEVDDKNYVAENSVGTTLLEEQFKTTGQSCTDEAFLHFRNAVRINSQYSLALLNQGYCRQVRGQLAGAIVDYKNALQYARNTYLRSRSNINLGAAYDELGDFANSREHYNSALKMNPRDREILNDLAKVDLDETIASMSRDAVLHPSAQSSLQIGQLQQRVGRLAEARTSYEHALQLNPNLADARAALRNIGDKALENSKP